jgi:hypothetical protein
MNNRSLMILGILAVGMTVWAALQTYYAGHTFVAPEMTYLIQGLDPAGIESITVGAGKEAFTLNRQDKGFVVASKGGYPAVIRKVNELIANCLDLEVRDRVTSNPANHKDLEVAEDNAVTLIKFLDGTGKLITGIVLGKAVPQGSGSYVRAVGSNDVYVCGNVPRFSKQAIGYVDDKLLEIRQDAIESLTLTGPAGSFTLKLKDGAPGIVMENLPPGKVLKQSDAEDILQRLDGLTFSDVMERRSADAQKLKFDRKVICRLKDSTVYTLELAKGNVDYYLTCAAKFTGKAPAMQRPTSGETQEEAGKRQAHLAAMQSAEAFAEKHSDWVYRVEQWRVENLVKDMPELLEAAKPATQPGATRPAADGDRDAD